MAHNENAKLPREGALSDIHELLNISLKAERLILHGSFGCDNDARIARRFVRLSQFPWCELTERELGTIWYVITTQFSRYDPFANHPCRFRFVQEAIVYASCAVWERLWDDKHPDRLGQAGQGQDLELIALWRDEVRKLFEKWGEEKALKLTADEYAEALVEAGANETELDYFMAWMANVTEDEGVPPST